MIQRRVHLATLSPLLEDDERDEKRRNSWTAALRAAARDRVCRRRDLGQILAGRPCSARFTHEALTAVTLARWSIVAAKRAHVHALAPLLLTLHPFATEHALADVERWPAFAI